MATKPDLIKWVSNDDALKILDPGTTKKANGFIYQEKPAFQYINYLFNRLSKWLRGLQGSYAQVVVGSSSQVTDYTATHTILQLDNTVVAQGSRVLFLEGTHALTANLTLTNADLTFEMENGAAIIDLATFKLSLSGANVDAKLRVTNPNGAADSVSVGGSNSRVFVSGLSITQLTVGATGFGVAQGTVTGAKLKNTLVLIAGDVIDLTAGQIKFPATQIQSSDANTLDDYEEGTWTPGLTFGGAAVGMTFSTQTGSYQKIGNRVTLNWYLTLSNKGSSAGAAYITGLPFVVRNNVDSYSSPVFRAAVISYSGMLQGLVVTGGTTIQFEDYNEAGGVGSITNTDFENTSSVIGSLSYRTDG
jgi:hypothetical protein